MDPAHAVSDAPSSSSVRLPHRSLATTMIDGRVKAQFPLSDVPAMAVPGPSVFRSELPGLSRILDDSGLIGGAPRIPGVLDPARSSSRPSSGQEAAHPEQRYRMWLE